jgi:tRNA A37 methylthiotransferase MiaB
MPSIDKKEHPITRRTPRATVSLVTLGCKTNQFESASMQESLQSAGYQVVPFDDGAGVVIVNTCTVTNATRKPCKIFPV